MIEQNNPHLGSDELSSTIDEYRKRLDEIVRKEQDKYRQQIDEESRSIIDHAWQKAEAIIAEAQQKAMASREGFERKTREEAESIINTAKRQTQLILDEADERSKKEARNRTRLETEKLLAKARDESREITAVVQRDAEQKAGKTIAAAQAEADRLLKSVRDNCQAEVRAQTQEILAEVRSKAECVFDDVVRGSADISKLISGITQRTDAAMEKFKHDLQMELADSSKLIADAKQKLENIMAETISECEAAATINAIHEELNNNVAIAVELRGEKEPGSNGSGPLFKGEMQLKTLSACPYLQIKKLKNFLSQIPNIKLLEEYTTEDETVLLYEVKTPLPVMDILGSIPSLAESITQGDNLRLVLKN